jgi:hypothetical protein
LCAAVPQGVSYGACVDRGEVETWLRDLGFGVEVEEDEDGIHWANLTSLPSGRVVAPRYGRGETPEEAVARAKPLRRRAIAHSLRSCSMREDSPEASSGRICQRSRAAAGFTPVIERAVLIQREDGKTEESTLSVETLSAHHSYRLTLRTFGETWVAEAGDVFECLRGIRRQVEPRGLRLCCNGARRDAWSSGMQRDMGQGLTVYILQGVPKGTRPPQVDTLDHAPCHEVVPVEEQEACYRGWLGESAP